MGQTEMLTEQPVFITNQFHSVLFPWEPGLLEWLQEQYPFSKYHLVTLE